jgi:hypothetical protein
MPNGMPPMPMGGMPGGGPDSGLPPMGMPPGGMPQDPMAADALGALDQLSPKSPNPTEALSRIDKGLLMAHRIVMSLLPQVSQWNPKLARDLHKIGADLLGMRGEIQKEADEMAPPPMLGMPGPGGGGPMGLPGPMPIGNAGESYLR